jgi:hypothetical protein
LRDFGWISKSRSDLLFDWGKWGFWWVEKWKERIWILRESKSRSDLLFDVLEVVTVIMVKGEEEELKFYIEINIPKWV